MTFLIVSHVLHHQVDKHWYAYAPYTREMNIWGAYAQKVMILAPLQSGEPSAIEIAYTHPDIDFHAVPAFSLSGWKGILHTLVVIPGLLVRFFHAMGQADHIHLRCPGNMGLIACFVQIFFPGKPKTAKYAGNWDWASKQPWSYRLQQRILRNTFLTRNMKVLVYGEWPDLNQNILPFFTASYREKDICPTPPRPLQPEIRLIFVGTLSANKNPLIALQVCALLNRQGIAARLDLFGEGPDRPVLEQYIKDQGLLEKICLHGNVAAEIVRQAYQQSHFLIFLSRSEGWPKAVAESMFWGCLPLTSPVSCVPQMLGHGTRGDLIEADPRVIADRICHYLSHPEDYARKSQQAMEWSRVYTLERFEVEVAQLLQP